ncbi:MAG: tRNA (adenine-N1)-methyltransferase [Chloroflexi bacterium]|nr:MAG: tRNA (adenine-N1)-methyltransferase [Chloroflexota bacterium]
MEAAAPRGWVSRRPGSPPRAGLGLRGLEPTDRGSGGTAGGARGPDRDCRRQSPCGAPSGAAGRQALARLLARRDPRGQALSGPLQAGDLVLLHDRAGRVYQVTLKAGAAYSLHSGSVRHDDLIGQLDGTIVATASGVRLLALRPTFAEWVEVRKRAAQPIYPKDLGAIVVLADLYPGARVLEAGSGTGALTIAALRAVGPTGQVVSYEVREDFLAASRTAVEEALQGALLDLPEPWRAVPAFAAALRAGGILFVHCPNVSQVERLAASLRDHGGFGLIQTVEILLRGWTIKGRSTRPDHRMVAHTGFLTFARRLASSEVFETETY